LLFSFTTENDKEIRAMMDKDYATKYAEVVGKVYANIDYSKFRDDFNKSQIISIINWTVEGYSNKEVAGLKHDVLTDEKYRRWLKEIDEYMKILKKAFYKEEN
jgi:TetR/AcrR family transcriptional regulator